MQSVLPVLAVHYVEAHAARDFFSRLIPVLGVVGYGQARPAYLSPSCPYIMAPLPPAAVGPVLEIWTTASACRPAATGPVVATCSDDFAFGMVAVESGEQSLEATAEQAYLHIFDFLEANGFPAPLRFWNYLASITGDDQGLERYMRFNIGRHRAFSARLRQPVPPAASAVGARSGASVIYFLAAREPAAALENPRQVSAYSYPAIYGPRSPSFSRASVLRTDSGEAVFISGTASIVGHETRHAGDLAGQIAETSENLRALIGAVRRRVSTSLSGRWAVKTYLRDPAQWMIVEQTVKDLFNDDSERLYLQAELCRTGLLLEIEAFHPARKLRSGPQMFDPGH